MTDQTGRRLARGARRHLARLGMLGVLEYAPARGLRCDLAALSPQGEIWMVEVKSSRADFRADRKWEGYLDWCDRFFFAAPLKFPHDILPQAHGLILADDFGAEITRPAPLSRLAPARRKAQTLRLARAGLTRLHMLEDPDWIAG